MSLIITLPLLSTLFGAGAVAKTSNEAHPQALQLSELEIAAARGDVDAQLALGQLYFVGSSVSLDVQRAELWWKKAAEQGSSIAEFKLGALYEQGALGARNYPEALKWYKLAAQQRVGYAANNLGWMYHDGHGVPKDDVMADMWFRVASLYGAGWRAGVARFFIELSMSDEEIQQAKELAAGRCQKSGRS